MTEAVHARREQEAEEARLVAGLRQADPDAHAELYARYGSRVYRYLVSRLGQHRQLAEDLLVQTLAQAAQHIARYHPHKASLTAWLFGIARREVQLEWRAQQRRSSVPGAAQVPITSLSEQASPDDVAEGTVARLEAQRKVAQLAQHLSALELEVLMWRCLHQLSVREIGHVIHRSERAVDSLLHRAKHKARERLADDA